MSLIPEKTQLESDLLDLEGGIRNVARQLQAVASVLNKENAKTWILGDARYKETQIDYQTSDQSVTNNDSSYVSSEVQVTLEAGETYLVEVVEHYEFDSTTPGARSVLTYSGTASYVGGTMWQKRPVNGANTIIGSTNSLSGSNTIAGQTSGFLRRDGIMTATTGGTLTLEFRQITSSADASTIKAGSWMRTTKV